MIKKNILIRNKNFQYLKKKETKQLLKFYFSFFFLNISTNNNAKIPIVINISATLKTNQ